MNMFPVNTEQKEKDLEWFREWTKRVKWNEAKTYRNTTPHEYVVCKAGWHGRDDFQKAFLILEKYMQVEKFFKLDYGYLYAGDGYKYFAADGGGWQDDRFILNRADAEVSYG